MQMYDMWRKRKTARVLFGDDRRLGKVYIRIVTRARRTLLYMSYICFGIDVSKMTDGVFAFSRGVWTRSKRAVHGAAVIVMLENYSSIYNLYLCLLSLVQTRHSDILPSHTDY